MSFNELNFKGKLISAFFMFAIISGVYAQKKTNPSNEKITFTTNDNITIAASYYCPDFKEKPIAAIILIHQGESSNKEWLKHPIYKKLVKENYAILAYDIRLHGKSGSDKKGKADLYNNPKRTPLDLLAAIKYLKDDKRIDAERIGIIGASIGGNLACVASSSDAYGIKSAVSLSPKDTAVQNLSGKKSLITPKNVFYIASRREQQGQRMAWSSILYARTKGERKIEIANGDAHASYILRDNLDLNNLIIEWFKKTL